MPAKRTTESFSTPSPQRSCQRIEKEMQRMKGKLGGGGVGKADKNGMSNFILSPLLFQFTNGEPCSSFDFISISKAV